MNDISTELLEFKKNYTDEFSDQTLITINNLVNKLYIVAKTNHLWWYPPKISIGNADGTLSLEWKYKDKVLFIDILENAIKYDALWGVLDGLVSEEACGEKSGSINIENDLTEFWEWIAK